MLLVLLLLPAWQWNMTMEAPLADTLCTGWREEARYKITQLVVSDPFFWLCRRFHSSPSSLLIRDTTYGTFSCYLPDSANEQGLVICVYGLERESRSDATDLFHLCTLTCLSSRRSSADTAHLDELSWECERVDPPTHPPLQHILCRMNCGSEATYRHKRTQVQLLEGRWERGGSSALS